MKKVLLIAGISVLAASCTQDELTSLSVQNDDVKGIAFVAGGAPDSRTQWDYIEDTNGYRPYWYAEMDRVKIFSAGVNVGYTYASGAWATQAVANENYWKHLNEGVTYKATQSAQSGKFTAASDADLLGFSGDTEAKFFAVYPETADAEVDGTDVVISSLPSIVSQTLTGTRGQNKAIMMYAHAEASRTADYSSVGETVGLTYEWPLAALGLRTKNADKYIVAPADGASIFGKLKDITIQTMGYNADGEGALDEEEGDILPSAIAYDEAVATIKVDTTDFVATLVPGTPSTSGFDSTKVVLNINQEWNDNALAMASIRKVVRKDKFSADKPEKFIVTYNFENISLTSPVEAHKKVSIDFNSFITYPALDMDNFQYLVTNETSDNAADRTLIVNGGTFAEIFNEDGDIIWNEGAVDEDEINKIYVNNIALTAEECKLIATFDKLEIIELNENTSIAANTFSETQATQITSIIMPKVTSIESKFVADAEGKSFTALTNLNLAAYEFETENVNKTFFNASTKNTLVTLNMSGVKNMLPTFGIDRSLSFAGYALQEVTIQDGMKVAPRGFMNCTALTTVNGVVDLLNGDEAFKGASTLEEINVNGTVIPFEAFNSASALSSILYNGVQVKPTVVGEKALQSTSVKYMDLSDLETVGVLAFNAAPLTGPAEGEQIMEIGGEYISEKAFANTALKMVHFTEATSFGNDILVGTNNLIHLKFSKAFTVDEVNINWNKPFGITEKIDLFINPSQKYMSGTVMTLKYGLTPKSYTFKTVQKEN